MSHKANTNFSAPAQVEMSARLRQIITKGMVFRAAATDNAEILMKWINYGNDINIRDEDGDTVLIIAVRHEHTDLARELIRWSNINKNAQNNVGATALHYAALHNNLPILKELLYFGANKDIKDTHGNKAETWAVDEGHAEAADILHDYEAYPKSRKHKMNGGLRAKLSNAAYTRKSRR